MQSDGLATIKREGYVCPPDDTTLLPWEGCGKEFELYYKNRHSTLVRRLFGSIIKPIGQHAWDAALLENARKEQDDTD